MLCIKNGLIYDAISANPYYSDILIKNGKIEKIEKNIQINKETKVIDASDLNIYPGLIDAHCHLGLSEHGIGYEGEDTNEKNDIITPHLRAIDGINPLDISFEKALRAGVTCVATGPGSSNVLGGTFVAIKTKGKRIDDMIVKEPIAMKCAFGENPKRNYKEKGNMSRMTTAARLREMLLRTKDYMVTKENNNKQLFDMKLEALIPVINKEIPLKAHAHRLDDIFTAIRIAKEFDVRLTLEHCTEAYLASKEIAKENIPLAVGPSLTFATKYELKNLTFEAPAILSKAGCQVSIITDSPVIPQEYLSLCAGLAIKSGMDENEALKAITINPAKHIGIDDKVGSIEVGKDADFIIVEGSIFDIIRNKIRYIIVNGELI